MKTTEEILKKLKFIAILYNELDKYVYLREDDKGKYIEYAFQEGVPHDNRCLSWYDSYQENAYIRNGWTKNLSEEEKEKYLNVIKKNRNDRVGEIFELSSFTCGSEENVEERLKESKKAWEEYHPGKPFIAEDHICKVGCPAKKCRDLQCKHWTYEEPVKCACWYLNEPIIPKYVSIPIEIAMELKDKILNLK